jgi:hypothetical protein
MKAFARTATDHQADVDAAPAASSGCTTGKTVEAV